MRRGTTPTHTFQFPIDTSELEEIKVTYAQNKKTILSKYMKDCTLSGTSVVITLTQEETLKFSEFAPYQIQVRALTKDGQAMGSEIITRKVLPILDSEVLT